MVIKFKELPKRMFIIIQGHSLKHHRIQGSMPEVLQERPYKIVFKMQLKRNHQENNTLKNVEQE